MSGRGDKVHLVERAAERLVQAGRAPTGLHAPVATSDVSRRIPAEAAAPSLTPVDGQSKIISMSQLSAAGLVDPGTGRSRIAEELRLVQSQVLRTAFSAGGEPGFANILMVTSSGPGEGKTFTSLNLAASIAQLGDHRVLLIDADAKHGSLTDTMGLDDTAGLLELAADPSMDPAVSVGSSAIEGLSIMPVGRHRAGRIQLFASSAMRRLIQSLGRRFADRLIILDVPPCLSTSDPAALSTAVGQIVFVVEAERTQREEVEASLDLIQSCPTITLLLNKVQMSMGHSFGSYSYSYSS